MVVKKRWLIPLLIVLLSGYAIVKDRVDEQMSIRRQDADIRYLPSPGVTSFLAFGYKPAVADLFWIETLNYFGGELVSKKRTYKYIPQYLEIIVKLDPLFNMFYEWASTISIYNALPITRESVVSAVKYANLGIINLSEKGRYDSAIISKAAFNFALEARDYENSIPYFRLVGRSFPQSRDFLLVGSTYAGYANLDDIATELKLEYLGFAAFEAQNRAELNYALNILLSPRFNREAENILKDLRLSMEKDEDLRKVVENRLKNKPAGNYPSAATSTFTSNPKLKKILEVDLSRNWLPPDLHLMLTL